MRIQIENVGPLKKATVEFGDMTVVCGKNNNGKTHLAYVLCALMSTLRKNFVVSLKDVHLTELMSHGEVVINLVDYASDYISALQGVLPAFVGALPRFMAMHPDRFKDARVLVDLREKDVVSSICAANPKEAVVTTADLSQNASIEMARGAGSSTFTIAIVNKAGKLPTTDVVFRTVSRMLTARINENLSSTCFPDVFAITCERTGISLFSKELLEVREKDSSYIDTVTPDKFDSVTYQLPIEREILFVRNLGEIVKRKSYLAAEHPEIIMAFNELTDGTYFYDEGEKRIKFSLQIGGESLSLQESSSTVRSLAEFAFYLSHCAAKNQLLMIDEPELNLHPENQRRLARILVMLVNAGIRVFMTTHSDYMVRELNAILNISVLDEEMRKKICTRHNIEEQLHLDPEAVRFYILEDGMTKPVEYEEEGCSFGVKSFDDTIEAFDALYNDLRNVCYE